MRWCARHGCHALPWPANELPRPVMVDVPCLHPLGRAGSTRTRPPGHTPCRGNGRAGRGARGAGSQSAAAAATTTRPLPDAAVPDRGKVRRRCAAKRRSNQTNQSSKPPPQPPPPSRRPSRPPAGGSGGLLRLSRSGWEFASPMSVAVGRHLRATERERVCGCRTSSVDQTRSVVRKVVQGEETQIAAAVWGAPRVPGC